MPETLPLFPLQTVLLPGAPLPLHIFEPRYRQLTLDLITGTVPGKRFGVIAVKPSLEVEVTTLDQLRAVGCAAVLRQASRLPDGRYDLVTSGDARFRLLELDTTSAPYLVGTIEWLPDADFAGVAESTVELLRRSARSAHRRYCAAAWRRADWSEPSDDIAPQDLAHRLAADCLLSIDDRQRLLEETRPLHRLRLVGRLLSREAGIVTALRAVPAPPAELRGELSLN